MKKKLCAVPLCDYPDGQCYGTCFHPEELRMDLIGQNGNTGEHYHQEPQIGLEDDLASMLMDGVGSIEIDACEPKEGQS